MDRLGRHEGELESDASLLVEGAPRERRVLLQLALPAANSDAELIEAALLLTLGDNADVTRSARLLGLHQLTREVGPSTSWRSYSNKKWDTAGGDFGPELTRTSLLAGQTSSEVVFEITELIRSLESAASTTLSMVILEIGAAPAAPAQLAFVSMEGDASKAPLLRLSYCEP